MALGFVSFLTQAGCGVCRGRCVQDPAGSARLSWPAGKSREKPGKAGECERERGPAALRAGLFITGARLTVTDGLGPGLALYHCKNHTSQGAE